MRISDWSSDVCSSDLRGRRMAEYRQAEGRLGDENVARHDLEARAGRVGPPLVIAGDDDPLALIFHQDLRAAEHMPRGMEAEAHPAAFEALAVSECLIMTRLVIDAIAQRTPEKLRAGTDVLSRMG